MKKVLFSLFMLITSFAFSQESTSSVLFAQCYFNISDRAEMLSIETEMKNHANAKMVRLDFETQRAFILTKNLNSLSTEELTSWFAEYGGSINCVQIGVYGVDPMEKYPFTNCED